MLELNDRIKISSDNSRRFISKKSFKIYNLSQRSDVWEHKILTRGVWIINQSGSFYTRCSLISKILVKNLNSNDKIRLIYKKI